DVKSTDTQEEEDVREPSSILGLGLSNTAPVRREQDLAPEESEIRSRDERAAIVSDPDMQLHRTTDEPFRRADVGAESAEADRLERDYDRDNAARYAASQTSQDLRGEFAGSGTAPSGTRIAGNAPNTSDTEFRTPEGDSRFNVADPQLRENTPDAYASDSGVTPELSDIRRGQETQGLGTRRGPQSEGLGARVGNRWERFQDRLRNDREQLTGDCPGCEKERNRAA
ncbi:MAG: hypothetical protein JOZ43_00020, partial [Acidobacteriales bacterium]|nr:hypothetical protein [Terriglobales bacterium]